MQKVKILQKIFEAFFQKVRLNFFCSSDRQKFLMLKYLDSFFWMSRRGLFVTRRGAQE